MKNNNIPWSIQQPTHFFELPSRKVQWNYNQPFQFLKNQLDLANAVVITDENVWQLHEERFKNLRTIVISHGEENKHQRTIDRILQSLLEMEINKSDTIIAVGGGVVTDIAGFAASIYKRGMNLILVPTSLLGMVDAALGGKNGIDAGEYKNMIGTVYQPHLLWYDLSFLNTLPLTEWQNGFAEIIKHACIHDREMFELLEQHGPDKYYHNPEACAELIERNVKLKMQIVMQDELDSNDRQLLNFGHTIGHAIEKKMQIPHGQAISIGMVAAAQLSVSQSGFSAADVQRVSSLLQQYGLPVNFPQTTDGVFEALRKDKKRENDIIRFVTLSQIGSAKTERITLDVLQQYLLNPVR